jgi:hypothetical protein
LIDKLQISDRDVYDVSGPLGASAFFAIAQLSRSDLRDPEHIQVTPAQLATGTDIFSTIARGDLMVHLPYESFTPVLDFLDQASTDPDVLAIKMTLYRTGSNPALIRSVIGAADSGKQVAVCVEIKARFDEENNIAWAKALERAGVRFLWRTGRQDARKGSAGSAARRLAHRALCASFDRQLQCYHCPPLYRSWPLHRGFPDRRRCVRALQFTFGLFPPSKVLQTRYRRTAVAEYTADKNRRTGAARPTRPTRTYLREDEYTGRGQRDKRALCCFPGWSSDLSGCARDLLSAPGTSRGFR